ncbi:MAG: hypothetical protein ACI915_001197 [Gammaproteobacteria bacterium]|jgi:hypothetical protein
MNKSTQSGLVAIALACLFSSSISHAADAGVAEQATKIAQGEEIGIEITRDAYELKEVIATDRDSDVIDTVLIFSNTRSHRNIAVCVGYDANGNVLGRAFTVIPANGLRFIRASDLADGTDFLGSAKCVTRPKVIPSSFVVGVGFSDAPASVVHGRNRSRIRFPVVASY